MGSLGKLIPLAQLGEIMKKACFLLVVCFSFYTYADVQIIQSKFEAVGTELPQGVFQYLSPKISLGKYSYHLAYDANTASIFCQSLGKNLVSFTDAMYLNPMSKAVRFDLSGSMKTVSTNSNSVLNLVTCK